MRRALAEFVPGTSLLRYRSVLPARPGSSTGRVSTGHGAASASEGSAQFVRGSSTRFHTAIAHVPSSSLCTTLCATRRLPSWYKHPQGQYQETQASTRNVYNVPEMVPSSCPYTGAPAWYHLFLTSFPPLPSPLLLTLVASAILPAPSVVSPTTFCCR